MLTAATAVPDHRTALAEAQDPMASQPHSEPASPGSSWVLLRSCAQHARHAAIKLKDHVAAQPLEDSMQAVLRSPYMRSAPMLLALLLAAYSVLMSRQASSNSQVRPLSRLPLHACEPKQLKAFLFAFQGYGHSQVRPCVTESQARGCHSHVIKCLSVFPGISKVSCGAPIPMSAQNCFCQGFAAKCCHDKPA